MHLLQRPRHIILLLLVLGGVAIGALLFAASWHNPRRIINQAATIHSKPPHYWFLLKRASNVEHLYQGVPGNINRSRLIKTFFVKTGIAQKRPTPLPQLVGREYWNIVKKEFAHNPQTGPYFLTLDVPASGDWPYGPVPYEECDGQCDWVTPGYFGLHGVGDDITRLTQHDPGSSGCIRHSNEDIAYLYQLLSPEKNPIRYYVRDI